MRLSTVGTPVTSSTSYSRRWKTGAMLTYEIRPSLNTAPSVTASVSNQRHMEAASGYRAGVSDTGAARTALVEDLMARFPHVPPEAVLKEDLLRTGIAFDASAL